MVGECEGLISTIGDVLHSVARANGLRDIKNRLFLANQRFRSRGTSVFPRKQVFTTGSFWGGPDQSKLQTMIEIRPQRVLALE